MSRMMLRVACLIVVAFGVARAAADPFVDAVRERCVELLAADGELRERAEEAFAVANTAATWAGPRQYEAIAWGEATAHLLNIAQNEVMDSIGALGNHPTVCLELGLLIEDDGPAAILLAARLCEARPEAVDAYPALAAAVSVVHDRDYRRRINENRVSAPGALEIFDYFVENAGKMRLDPADMPALLLVHVVDVTESIEQLEWALARYRGDPDPGSRFFEIQYDYEHFRRGTTKKVTEAGDYRLESIKQHGGVCADQAYFAESVGKACGVPTAYVVARGADVSHAWIGFLDERRGRWNFDEGRYDDYQNIRGTVVSPQTGQRIADADIGVLGGLMRCKPAEIHATMGVGLAVGRMSTIQPRRRIGLNWQWESGERFDDDTMRGTLRKARTDSSEDRLKMLQLAMRRCASVPSAWEQVSLMAQRGDLDQRDMDAWARAVDSMCGTQFPDFSFDVISSLVDSVEDAGDRQGMWEWAFGRYRRRPDLASAVRFEQGEMFKKDGDPANAWLAYEDVVKNFINDGPMVVSALGAMRDLLDENGKRGEIVAYLEDAAKKVRQPPNMGESFASQSNYYRIHKMLAEELDRVGRGSEAREIRERVGIGDG